MSEEISNGGGKMLAGKELADYINQRIEEEEGYFDCETGDFLRAELVTRESFRAALKALREDDTPQIATLRQRVAELELSCSVLKCAINEHIDSSEIKCDWEFSDYRPKCDNGVSSCNNFGLCKAIKDAEPEHGQARAISEAQSKAIASVMRGIGIERKQVAITLDMALKEIEKLEADNQRLREVIGRRLQEGCPPMTKCPEKFDCNDCWDEWFFAALAATAQAKNTAPSFVCSSCGCTCYKVAESYGGVYCTDCGKHLPEDEANGIMFTATTWVLIERVASYTLRIMELSGEGSDELRQAMSQYKAGWHREREFRGRAQGGEQGGEG